MSTGAVGDPVPGLSCEDAPVLAMIMHERGNKIGGDASVDFGYMGGDLGSNGHDRQMDHSMSSPVYTTT